ncbi:MAG: winged helix-turn-helix domain-containing protein [Woeseiaceae bacterium]|nr:winged helix-turn-helix domain-containing protein [Woeseiaceae bacterium]
MTGRFRAGDLDLDIEQRRLTRHGQDLKLSKLNFKLLHVLTAAAPALVTKAELAKHVWSGRIVSPDTVAQRVKLLRNALQDDAQDPRYIEVVRGQGYRWIPDVVPAGRARRHVLDFVGNPESPQGIDLEIPSRPSVVVLPLDTMGDEQLEHRLFADALTHDIITSIGRARWLFVVARGSAFMFRGGQHFVGDVSKKLGVRYVVQGNIVFSGNRMSINIALADAVEGNEIWSERFRGTAGDVFDIQEKIANLVVGSVEAQIEYAEQKRALLERPANLDAWSAYHRGWWHLNSFSVDCCDQAERYFEKSIRLDPASSRTHAGFSSVHWLRAFLELTDDREREVQRALEFAQRSVELDARDPLAHWALGRALHLGQDFARSIAEFEIANDLNPNFALGQFAQAFALMHIGENESSNRILDGARRLSPYDPMSYAMLGIQAVNHAMLDRYETAADLSVRGARLLVHFCQMFPVIAAYCNVLAGRQQAARKYFAELQSSRPGYNSNDYFRAFPHQLDRDILKITEAFNTLEDLH